MSHRKVGDKRGNNPIFMHRLIIIVQQYVEGRHYEEFSVYSMGGWVRGREGGMDGRTDG